MRKIVLATTFLALLFLMNTKTEFFTSLKIVNCVESGTLVSGIVNTNTTWTLANSPYILKGPVLVNRSAVLTIEPGVIVNFTRYFIQVDGVLNARGNETHPIRFISVEETTSEEGSIIFTASSIPWDEAANFGSIIDHAIVTAPRNDRWQYRHIVVAIRIQGSSPRISNSIISNSEDKGIWIDSGSPLIVNNTIVNNRAAGIFVLGGAPLIMGNTIASCVEGIYIWGSSPKIYRNKIVMNGAEYEEGSGGISVDSNSQAIIANNTISGNLNGVTLSYSPSSILHNNIMGNKYYDARLWGSSDVNVTYNWWGTTDTSQIDERVWDFYDDFRLGKVIYIPFLNAPSPGAPSWDGAPPTVDRIPPTIKSIVRTPQGAIQPNQKVTISAKVTDADSGVKEVVLLYSLDGGASWINVTMNFNITSGFWEGTIPGQPAGTQIQYQVIAYDNAGNYVTTPTATLQIPPNQNPPPSTPLTPLTIILVILFVISVIGITVLKLKKKNQPSTT
ncbi:MAG: right-handed parallel beta-helix repeat-containing protein [Candidatus Bathyarchaeia archaeon]